MNNLDRQVKEILNTETPALPRWSATKPWDRHGLILAVAGSAYIFIGVLFATSPETRLGQASLNVLPGNIWYFGFVIAGIISATSSRWPNRPRTLGYSALTGWTAACGGLYLFTGFADNSTSFIAMGIVWGVLAFLWWAISGLISPPNERGRYARVPSPHRDRVGGADWCSRGSGNAEIGVEDEPFYRSRD